MRLTLIKPTIGRMTHSLYVDEARMEPLNLGVLAALTIGLLLNAAGGALRGAINDVLWLYAMTIVMGAGVAIMQVAMPPAVRAWVPQQRIAFATAVYTNGLLIGEILPVALMLPLVLF